MANYCAVSRSNYFRVKDPEAFKKWVDTVPDLRTWERSNGEGLYAITAEGDSGGWPVLFDDDEGDERDLIDELAAHLDADEVAVLFEVGWEKLRYVHGSAIAVSNDDTGQPQFMELLLSDIYTRIREEWGIEPTRAEY